MNYAFGEKLCLEESRGVEFKEVRGNNPVSAIVNTADEYAVAFLNAEGGRILWGVRDSDKLVVGIPLDERQRDRLRKSVADKLHSIQPPIDPTQFEFNLHPVRFTETPDSLYVAELVVPGGQSTVPYYTAGNEMFVRLDGVKKKLTALTGRSRDHGRARTDAARGLRCSEARDSERISALPICGHGLLFLFRAEVVCGRRDARVLARVQRPQLRRCVRALSHMAGFH
jgi:hypothetical protein